MFAYTFTGSALAAGDGLAVEGTGACDAAGALAGAAVIVAAGRGRADVHAVSSPGPPARVASAVRVRLRVKMGDLAMPCLLPPSFNPSHEGEAVYRAGIPPALGF